MATNLWINLPESNIGGSVTVSGTVTSNQGAPNIPANAWPVFVENALVTVAYDYIAATYPSGTQEVYTFKSGGSGGTTVATVTVNYTDTTKAFILNVART